MRRLGVLCTAHRRTLRAVIPDHVANSLRKSCGGDINDVDVECKETRQRQNYVTTNTRPIPLTIIVKIINYKYFHILKKIIFFII